MRIPGLALAVIVVAGCNTTSVDDKPLTIVGGKATIYLAQARSPDGKITYADWSTTSAGEVNVGSDGTLFGDVNINGSSSRVYGNVVELHSGLRFDVSGLPPGAFIVHTAPGLDRIYALFSFYDQYSDVTGDSIPENWKLYLELRK